jgi:hypothetical protein
MSKYKQLIQSIDSIELQLNELKLQLLDLDKSNSLLIVSNNVKNYDQLINCCKDNVKVIVFDQTKPFDEFKNNVINELNQNSSLDNVGWLFDSLNQKSLTLSSDYVIDLTNKHNVEQYQQLIDLINSISKFVKSSDDKSPNPMSKPRFDLISCDLDEEHYNHMVQILELCTDFDYAYSSKIIGNSESNINWSLDMFNNTKTTATETVDLTENYFNADKLNKLESGSIMLGSTSTKFLIPYATVNGTIKVIQLEISTSISYPSTAMYDTLSDLIRIFGTNKGYSISSVKYSQTVNPPTIISYSITYKSTDIKRINYEVATYIKLCFEQIVEFINNTTDLTQRYTNYTWLKESKYQKVFENITFNADGFHVILDTDIIDPFIFNIF